MHERGAFQLVNRVLHATPRQAGLLDDDGQEGPAIPLVIGAVRQHEERQARRC
jgi:hypothetical protein